LVDDFKDVDHAHGGTFVSKLREKIGAPPALFTVEQNTLKAHRAGWAPGDRPVDRKTDVAVAVTARPVGTIITIRVAA